MVELPVPIVAAVCGELRKRNVVADERPGRLTPGGRELFGGGTLRLGRAACPACAGRGIVVPGELWPLAAGARGGGTRRASGPARARSVPLHGRHEAAAPARRPRGRCTRRPPRPPARRRRSDRAGAPAPRPPPRHARDRCDAHRRRRRHRAPLLPRARARGRALSGHLRRARPPRAAAARARGRVRHGHHRSAVHDGGGAALPLALGRRARRGRGRCLPLVRVETARRGDPRSSARSPRSAS